MRKEAKKAPKRNEDKVRQLSQENAIIAEIGRIISSTLNIDDVYGRFAEKVRDLIPFDWIAINTINREGDTVIAAYFTEVDIINIHRGDPLPLSNSMAGEVLKTRSSLLIQKKDGEEILRRLPRLSGYFEAGFKSMIAVPLISKDEVIGVLHVRSKEVDYTETDLRLAERVGHQIAGAIANAQLFTERKQAEEALKRNQEELIKKNEEIEASKKNLQLALEELEGAYKELKATHSKILQQEKMASIGQLAAGVAHEINNPMAFISSNLGTLDKYVNRLTEFIQTQSEVIESLHTTEAIEGLKGKQKELKLDYITEDIKGLITESLDGSERVRKIVQGLKSFARVDEAEYKYADINECIESTINIVWNELKYKATLKKDYGNLPLTKCYPQQINQVFMNLLINAGHAIESQGEITIKTWAEDGSIWVAISDTGHGIPKEDLNKIFEPFFTTKEVGKGTGLGLSITYEIVQKHDGEITVESEVGKGTTFTVRLPIT
jgi:signal transduction histidine kinase